jgi:hypothetical protein
MAMQAITTSGVAAPFVARTGPALFLQLVGTSRGGRRLATAGLALIQCCAMANWRQIQARIRKAKNSPEAAVKLADLFQKTRDAMVAFELAVVLERAGQNEDCVRWYSTAAERFRREEWKKKAEDALIRLGAPLPAPSEMKGGSEGEFQADGDDESAVGAEPKPAPEHRDLRGATAGQADVEAPEAPVVTQASPAEHKRRRRGRRGGRGHRRKGTPQAPNLPSHTFTESAAPVSAATERPLEELLSHPSLDRRGEHRESEMIERPAETRYAAPPEHEHRRPSSHGRAGEPALASRLGQLESTLRRLVSGIPHRLEETEEAPAGPGVFLLSDSDLVTSYYVESCQTLRIGLGHLVRGGRGPRTQTGGTLRARLADHLGISESKVSDYMRKHCVVRWVQLDEDAPYFANFVIGVLRTPLNV